MGVPKLFLAITAAIYIFSWNTLTAQNRTAELCSAKLPTGRSEMASVYDGNDTIYLFGGYGNGWFPREVLKYSISEDTIEIAGELPRALPFAPRGLAVMNKLDEIFYFNSLFNQDIYQYFPANNTFATVSSFGDGIGGETLIKLDADTALIFDGGPRLNVTSLNLNTLKSETIADISQEWDSLEAIWMGETETAYIFTSGDIIKYFPIDNRIETLGKGADLTERYAVTDGRYIYLFGQLLSNGTGIILFDPETEEMMEVQVEKKPPLAWPTVVFVEKLNRIYVFGGYTPYEFIDVDDIYYISLEHMKTMAMSNYK